MKKVLFFLFSAALLLFAAGCDKDPQDNIPVFPDPATKDQAVSILFNKGEVLQLELPERIYGNGTMTAGSPVKVSIPQIDLSEANRYILYIGNKTVWTGRYTYDSKNKLYSLEDVGTIELKEASCIVTPVKVRAALDGPVEVPATIIPLWKAATSVVMNNLSRTWKVASTYITVDGGKNNVSFSKGFNGCDFHEIGKYCKDMKVSLSDDDLASLQGYKVQEFMLEGNNSIIITFDSKDPYYGSYTANGNSFHWNLNDSNILLSATAVGAVSFPGNGVAELVMNSHISAGSEKYTATITMTLEPVY